MNIVRLLIATLMVEGTMEAAYGASAADPSEACDTHWQELSQQYTKNKSPPDYEGLLRVWQPLKKECSDSPRYWARLALTYFYLDKTKEAQSAIAAAYHSGARLDPLVELVQIIVDASALRGGAVNQAELESIERRLFAYAEANPRDGVGLSLVADVLSQLGRHETATAVYEAVLKALGGPSPQLVGLMRNLTISYADVGRYQEAHSLAAKALSFDKSLQSDPYFACAVAEANAGIGKVDKAKQILTWLANDQPEIRENPVFLRSVEFVKQKMQVAQP
jgi:tetratricopeptide (TPR) repeat protein